MVSLRFKNLIIALSLEDITSEQYCELKQTLTVSLFLKQTTIWCLGINKFDCQPHFGKDSWFASVNYLDLRMVICWEFNFYILNFRSPIIEQIFSKLSENDNTNLHIKVVDGNVDGSGKILKVRITTNF